MEQLISRGGAPKMTQAVRVRPIEQADLVAWRLLWDGYNAFYGRAGPTALSPEITAATWGRFFDFYFVCGGWGHAII